MTQSLTQSQLYEGDFVTWCEDTVIKLRARNFDALDVDNLIDEIESLAKRDRRGLKAV